MFAIVQIAGAQHKVKKGDLLEIEKLEGKEGLKFTSDKVLLKFDEKTTEIGSPYLQGAQVEFAIKAHGKGEKIKIFKKKPKKRYQKTMGHRQPFTTIEITAIQ